MGCQVSEQSCQLVYILATHIFFILMELNKMVDDVNNKFFPFKSKYKVKLECEGKVVFKKRSSVVVSNLDRAFSMINFFLRDKHGSWFVLSKYNKGRHLLLRGGREAPNYYVLYKKDFFNSYNEFGGEILVVHPEFMGLGESINESCLGVALHYKAVLLFIYPDGKVYCIHSETLWNLSRRYPSMLHVQKRSNVYKVPDFQKGRDVVHERVILFPLKLMELFGLLKD